MAYQLPLERFYHWEKTAPDKIFLHQPIDGAWHTWTWQQTGKEVRCMAAYLRSLNLPPNSNIGLVSKNCAHWIMADLAIMMSGHTSVPLYPNLTAESVAQVLNHCGAAAAFIGKLDNWPAMQPGVPAQIPLIAFPVYGPAVGTNWQDILDNTAPIDTDVQRNEGELMTIIYTSGSTGMPKGVMHKFGGVAFAASEASAWIRQYGVSNPNDRMFSYLPLAHVGERFFVEMNALYAGCSVYFTESIDKFSQNLREVQPTIMLGVHRIWKKLQEGILAKMPQEKLDRLLGIPLVSWLVRRKIKKALGFDRVQLLITSASPTPPDLIRWFQRLGIHLVEGYAMSENFAYSHCNPPDRVKIGTVGTPLPHCEVKLGPDNEVLVRNAAVMEGYYREPALTRETITEDGFLRTGDEGYIDAEGYLKITGRTKDLFKTAKGKYVVPSPIEMNIAADSDLESACVVGTGLPQPIALVTLSEQGRNKAKAALAQVLEAKRLALNATLDAHERLDKIVVMSETWTIDNNLLTPTFKIKRKEIENAYSAQYEKWASKAESVVFAEGA